MHIVILPVKLNKFSRKVLADGCKYVVKLVLDCLREYSTPVFCNKDQVNVHSKNSMTTYANIVDIFHKLTILKLWKDCKHTNSNYPMRRKAPSFMAVIYGAP
jgi:hypothetical protein